MATTIFRHGAVLALAAALFTVAAQAGPPLICHSFDIGGAKSLPWSGSGDWRGVDRGYDISRLTTDTLALLRPDTPVLARMETMRRATVYAVWPKAETLGLPVRDSRIAEDLLAKVMARAKESPAALFDAGYLLATYQQAGYQSSAISVDAAAAYRMVSKALEATHDAEMEFAAALITSGVPREGHDEHLRKARAAAPADALLARNLDSRGK
jgi:hypothetical protein